MKIQTGHIITKLLAPILFCILAAAGRAQTNDTVVSLEAEAAGLSLVAPDSVPVTGGTFWVVTSPTNGANGVTAPFPCPPTGVSGDSIYTMAQGIYLVDSTAGDTGASPSEIEAQAEAVSNLITQVEGETATPSQTSRTMGFHAMDDSGPPSFSDTNDDGGDYYTNLLSLPPINTNLLWLQITNVANGLTYLNLNMATDTVYSIWETTNLLTPFTNWQVVAEEWPTNETTNALPFTVETDYNTNLFWRAEDWTGVTLNGNTTPVWWFWEYFGTEDLSDTNLDSQGNTLGYDYEYGIDPNIIDFTLSTTNKYVRSPNVLAEVDLTAGLPSYYAVLVNDTNETSAIWLPYPGTNLILTLGSTNGIYNVWVGLRGLPTDATVTWNSFDLQYLYQTLPPVLTITNPVSRTVTQPMVQIQGFANVPLASLRYDLSNTNGIFTNQTGYLTSQYYDPTQLAATTNYFQCYDVPITLGSNTITLHAVDLAGNVGTTNFTLTLDYSGVTSPPALALVWPQPGTLIGGSNFTLQATVNDDTATVAASIAGTNGVTNTVAALVERNGNVWANNLPLAAGTNWITLTATNAAGLVNTTNFTVVQSAVNLTVSPISSDQLNQTTVTVTGTVTPGQNVYVNGVQASVDGSGNWTASSVPVNPTGAANLNVQATTSGGTPDSAQVANQAQPIVVVLADYNGSYSWGDENIGEYITVNWTYDEGGSWENEAYGPDWVGPSIKPRRNGLGGVQPMALRSDDGAEIPADGPGFTPPPGFTPTWQNEQSSLANGGGDSTLATTVTVASSGPSVVGQNQFYLVEGCAMEFSDPYDDDDNLLDQNFGGGSTGDVPVPPELLEINGQTLINTGETNTDGSTLGATIISAPAGAAPQFTVSDRSSDGLSGDFTFATPIATNLTLQILDANNGNANLSSQTNTVIVGQQMNFTCRLSITNSFMTNFPLSNFQWTVPEDALTNYYMDPEYYSTNAYTIPLTATNSQSISYFWVTGVTNQSEAINRIVQCSATINGKVITGQAVFQVLKPVAQIIATTSSLQIGNDQAGDPGLCFGTNGGPPGILFSNFLIMPAGTNYNYGHTQPSIDWWQVISPPYEAGVYVQDGSDTVPIIKEDTNSVVLDTVSPYGFNHTLPWPDTDDSPSATTSFTNQTGVIINQHSTMWLMFQPAGGQWVPLRSVSWYCSGSATNFGSGWIITSSSWSTNPPDVDAGTNYPAWTNNIYFY